MEEIKSNPLIDLGAGDAIPCPDVLEIVPQEIATEPPPTDVSEEVESSPLVATDSGFTEPASPEPVLLHQCGQCASLPTFLFDCLKVCTWLRVTNTTFQIYNHKLNFNGRFPTVELGGEEIFNSRRILADLSKQLNQDLDAQLTDEQKFLSFGLGSLVENVLAKEHSDWCRVKRADLIRAYGISLQKAMKKSLPNALLKIFFRNYTMSKHSSVPESIAVLETLSGLLAAKNFFFGPDTVSSLDVVSFASLAPILAISEDVRYEPRDVAKQKYGNLVAFVERMKNRFFPDWAGLCDRDDEIAGDSRDLHKDGTKVCSEHEIQDVSLETAV